MPQGNQAHEPQVLSPWQQALNPVLLKPVFCNRSQHLPSREQPPLSTARESPCTAMETQYSQKGINKYQKKCAPASRGCLRVTQGTLAGWCSTEKETGKWCAMQSLLLCPLWHRLRAAARQAALSMGFSRQEYQSRQPGLPGDFPKPGIEPMSLMSPVLAGGFFTTSTTWEVGEAEYPQLKSLQQNTAKYPLA